MSTINKNKIYGLWPSDIEGIDSLMELALNMRWSWNHSADELWKELDPTLWQLTRNPWIVLQTISHEELEKKMAVPSFRNKIHYHRSMVPTKSSGFGAHSCCIFQYGIYVE